METELDGLYFSPSAKSASVIFYKDYNDITIYVEDEGKEFEYETLLKKLLGNQFRIERIFGCGGKLALIHQYKTDKKDGCLKNTIYIADGDFDRYIKSNEMINCLNFIYLKTYNIENYYISEDACRFFIKWELKCLDKEVEEKFKFKEWREKIVSQSTDLFLVYCYLIKINSGEKVLSRSHYNFIDDKTGFERTDSKYQKFEDEVFKNYPNCQKEIENIKNTYIDKNGNDFFDFICGKFLITSLSCYVGSIVGHKINSHSFRGRLVEHFDISKLNYVREAIINAVS